MFLRLAATALVLGVFSIAHAQDMEPRSYSNAARTGNNFDLIGIAWQYRWGGGL